MNVSVLLLLAVFCVGFALGALLISIQRQVAIEKLRAEFQAKLEGVMPGMATAENESAAGGAKSGPATDERRVA
jgi:hypothetical protein